MDLIEQEGGSPYMAAMKLLKNRILEDDGPQAVEKYFEDHIQRARAAQPQKSDELSWLLVDLASFRLRMIGRDLAGYDNLDASVLDLFKEALQILLDHHSKSYQALCDTSATIANIKMRLGDYADAEPFLQDALRFACLANDQSPQLRATVAKDLIVCLRAQGNSQEAEQVRQKYAQVLGPQ
jgi:hypothetical protein